MQSLFSLSLYYTRYLLQKRAFVYIVILLLFLGFYIIPNPASSYVTFYIKNTAPYPNKYWIGNLAAVFSNLIISFLLLFIILGEKEKEISQKTYYLEDTSYLGRFFKYSSKVLALFFFSLIFLSILNLTLSINNSEDISFTDSILPIIYFCIPHLFVWSIFCFIVEYYTPYKSMKYLIYFITVFFIFSNDKLFKLIGLSELAEYLGRYTHSVDYSAGVISKSNKLKFITIKEPFYPLYYNYKLLWMLIGCAVIYLVSKIKIYRSISAVNQEKIETGSLFPIKVTPHSAQNMVAFKIANPSNLLLKDLFLFSQSFSKMNAFFIILFWCISFFIPYNGQKVLLPSLFLISITINNNYLYKLFFYDIAYLEKLAPYNRVYIWLSKFSVYFAFLIFLSVPHLIQIPSYEVLHIVLNLFLLSVFIVSLTAFLKNSVLADIIYIIVFASYFSGFPVLNILRF